MAIGKSVENKHTITRFIISEKNIIITVITSLTAIKILMRITLIGEKSRRNIINFTHFPAQTHQTACLQTEATPGTYRGLSPPKCHLAPSPTTMKHTGQESGGKFCEIFKFWSFLQSKSVNNVCKLFPLLGTSSARSPTGALTLEPTEGLPSPRPPGP